MELPDAYLSVVEALYAAGSACHARVKIKWVASDACITTKGVEKQLGDVDAVIVPGGFGVRGIEGMVSALTYARVRKLPTLGICLGMQMMVIEAARSLAGLTDANSKEFVPETPYPVVNTLEEQVEVLESGKLGGTMRLGSYPAKLTAGSIAAQTYGNTVIEERHRHRYEVNPVYREQLETAGLVVSGVSPDGNLVEVVELLRDVHPYYVGTQAHPEFKSRPTAAHPLFLVL